MTAFLSLAALLAALAAALLTRPLWWPQRGAGTTDALDGPDEMQRSAEQLRQLEALHKAGVLSAEQYAQSRRAVESRLPAAPAQPAVATPPVRRHAGLAAAMAAFVFVVAGAGYLWVGSPARLALGPGSSAEASAGGEGGADAPVTAEQIAAMVEKLAEHLKAKPDDAQGWFMLARAYVVMGKPADAVSAFDRASKLRPDDADLLADYADAMAMAHGRSLEGEPAKLVERALKADPANPKALALAGTVAFDRKDYQGAVGYWEALAKLAPPDSQFAQQLQTSLAEARRLAGVPATTTPTAPATTATTTAPAPPQTSAPTPSAMAAVAGEAGVSGTVSLAPALQNRVAPEDTVFVFARAADGPRMPLAVLRKKAKDLPLQFKLDDSMAMSADTRLSTAGRVVVGARISKSGNPMPQPGDLQALTPAAAVGASGLHIEINEEVGK
jgi:cytochrome c-type biogenesis protein CcmH